MRPDKDERYSASSEKSLEIRLGTYPEPRFLWWDSLARTGGSTTLRRYFIFIFLVPLLAAAISKLGFLQELHLPLTLSLAYGAGICLFLGAALVEISCPDINKVGRTFAAIEAEGRTKQYIIQQLRETYMALAASMPARANHFLKGFLRYIDKFPAEVISEVNELVDAPLPRQRVWQIAELLVQHPPDNKEAFWHIQWFAASTRPKQRIICFIFFLLGAVFALATLFVQAFTVYGAA